MSNRYYIAADGGGTKLFSVLFDDDFNMLSYGKSGAVNSLFTEISDVEKNMRQCVGQIFDGHDIKELECVYTSLAGPTDMFLNAISERVEIKDRRSFSEGYASLMAGIQKPNGILALSGTGSDVFYQEGERTVCVIGGWGALFGDEGSGYDIGVKTLRAAEFAFDGRGPQTLLTEMLKSDFGLKNIRDIVGCVYSVRDYRNVICAACLTACNAAAKGDETAIEIMRGAGRDMALQATTLIRRNNIGSNLDIVVSGSVWRHNPYMYESFRENVGCIYPDFKIHKPLFEPVMGGVVHRAMINGQMDSATLERLKTEFERYIYEK